MIFENLENLDNLSLDEKEAKFGNVKKRACSNKIFRSNMMLNPLNLKHLNNIDNMKADMITLNLEDAIAPSRKKEALYNTALFLSHLKSSNSFIIVRTNPIDAGGAEEIEFLNQFSFDGVRVSKVRDKNDLKKALNLLSKDKELHISMETKEAFKDLATLRIDDRFTTANIGILDLLTSLGLPQSLLKEGNPTIEYILSKFLVDAKSCGLLPISFMYQDYKNIAEFTLWCEKEREMGFTTKACMGPLQVEVANNIFGISKEEIIRATHIKEIFEKNAKIAQNGFMDVNYGFIDEPIYRDALLVLGL